MPQQQSDRIVYRVESYTSTDGKNVQWLSPVGVDAPPKCVGVIGIIVGTDANGKPITVSRSFEIDAIDVLDAYSKFDDLAKKAVKKLEDEMRLAVIQSPAPKIVTAH